MLFPIQTYYKLSTEFWHGRPINATPRQKTHPHGAWDAACPVGTEIHAPEPGEVYYMLAFRSDISRGLFEANIEPQPFDMRGHHYFYDTYGGIIILMGESGHTHVMAHSYINQLFNSGFSDNWRSQESPMKERWPVVVFHTFDNSETVRAGDVIGRVGNAGLSTGSHLHYEIHNGKRYQMHKLRIDPIELYPDEWRKHETDDRGYNWKEEKRIWV